MTLLKLLFYINCKIQYLFLKLIYGSKIIIRKNVVWRKNFNVMVGKKAKIIIGENCFFNNGCSLNALSKIEIGKGTIFGENVKIYDHNHRFSNIDMPIKQQGYTYGDINIGNHCWIASNVVILKGVSIGDNSVIGAGVIVSNDVPCNTIIKNNNQVIITSLKK